MSIDYIPTEAKVIKGEPLWWQKQGLSYTATGYGSKIPTEYRVKWNSRLYRVYCGIFSNCGAMYIISKGHRYYIQDYKFNSDERFHG